MSISLSSLPLSLSLPPFSLRPLLSLNSHHPTRHLKRFGLTALALSTAETHSSYFPLLGRAQPHVQEPMAASEADGSAATQTTASFREAFRAFRRRDRPLHLIHPASVLDPRPPVGPPSDTPDGAGESTTREDRSSRQQGRRSRNRDRHRSHRPTPAATEADPSRDCVYPAQLVPVSLPSDASSLPASHPTDTSSHDLTPASPLLNPRALWDVHSVEGVPGLLWVRGALAPGAAATLAEGCLHVCISFLSRLICLYVSLICLSAVSHVSHVPLAFRSSRAPTMTPRTPPPPAYVIPLIALICLGSLSLSNFRPGRARRTAATLTHTSRTQETPAHCGHARRLVKRQQ